jgi:hypothetical protein|nr:MAG TPA: YvrJ protein family protein [Caudoviricetes sp.]
MFHVDNVSRETFFIYKQIYLCYDRKKGGDNMQEVMTAINTVGLPTVVAIASMWYVKYREDKNDARIDKLNEAHKQEMSDITEALNNNTLALQRICDTFEQKKED